MGDKQSYSTEDIELLLHASILITMQTTVDYLKNNARVISKMTGKGLDTALFDIKAEADPKILLIDHIVPALEKAGIKIEVNLK